MERCNIIKKTCSMNVRIVPFMLDTFAAKKREVLRVEVVVCEMYLTSI